MKKDELIKAHEALARISQSLASDGNITATNVEDLEIIRQALDAQIKACDVPKIEGLGEAVTNANFTYRKTGRVSCEDLVKLSQAARAFHKITGGE